MLKANTGVVSGALTVLYGINLVAADWFVVR